MSSETPAVLQAIQQNMQKKNAAWYARTSWRIIQRLCLRARRELLSAQLDLRGPTEFKAVWAAVSSVGGFSPDRAESMLLYCLAKNGAGTGVIVEVGSYLGRSTCFLALGSKLSKREKVIAIDPHRGGSGDPGSEDLTNSASTFPMFQHHLRRMAVDDWVEPIRAEASEAVKQWSYGSIRLLFIDGLHTYEAMSKEIAAFLPYLNDQAIIVFDDYYPPEFPGVRKAVDEALAKGLLPHPQRRINRYAIFGLKRIADVVHG